MKILMICPVKIEYNNAIKILGCNNKNICDNFKTAGKIINTDEILIIKSGLGKVRACVAAVAGINKFKPDIVIDTGTCGSLRNDIPIGTIIVSFCCYEYDISGNGLPGKKQKNMKIQSGFDKNIDKQLIHLYNNKNKIFIGIQACGEFIIKDVKDKTILNKLFNADACNWETAGVFIGALNQKVPCLSIRIISDLADENIFSDFKNNIQQGLVELYNFIKVCLEERIFENLLPLWKSENIEIYF